MMPRILIAAVAMALSSGFAWAMDKYTVDSTYTIPTFEISHLGITTQQGRFDKATGTIYLDLAAKKGSVEIIIDTTSLNMSSRAWTRHLAEPELFDSAKHPTMVFKSSMLTFREGKVVAADGEFTMKGITRPLRVEVSGFRCLSVRGGAGSICGGDVTATVKRSDFGITQYIPEVSDEIKIRVPIEAFRD